MLKLNYLQPLRGTVKRRKIAVFDIESKKDDTQEAGFTRPFLVGFFDGVEYLRFANDPCVAHLPWDQRHIAHGGCIDKFLRWLFALDGCDICNKSIFINNGRPKRCNCTARRRRYNARESLIYSHNGGKFDELFVLGWLIQNRHFFNFEIASVQSRIQRLDVWPKTFDKKKLSWSFLDSIAILPLSLEKAAEAFAPSDKQKLKQDLNVHEDHPSWDEYLEMDCRALHASLASFHKVVEGLGGEVGITAPATAMKLYRRSFMNTWIARNDHFEDCDGTCRLGDDCHLFTCDKKCHGCAHEWIRKGYYGGRTELFKSYGRDIYYFDINSSYPASMLGDMPVGDMLVRERDDKLPTLEMMAEKNIGFVECEVYIPKTCEIPPLPFRYNGKLVFPTGYISGVWPMDELRLLQHPIVNGHILKVHKSVWYKRAPVFRDMVLALYEMRQKHTAECRCYGIDKGIGRFCGKKICKLDYNEGLAQVAKLMLNSLYGKFGMREDRSGVVLVDEGDPKPINGWPVNGQHDSLFWEVERICSASYIIPQISSHITGQSRIRLWHGMAEVVMRGGTLYYVDTDSIMASVPITESDGLGGWKREEPDVLLEGRFILPKLYQLKRHQVLCSDVSCQGCRGDSVQKMKGVGGKAQTPDNFRRMVDGGEVIEFDRLQQHRTMLNRTILSPKVISAKKSVRTKYDKRELLLDGSTRPLYMERLGPSRYKI